MLSSSLPAAAVASAARSAAAAREWLAFIRSPASLAIFEGYGFKPYVEVAK